MHLCNSKTKWTTKTQIKVVQQDPRPAFKTGHMEMACSIKMNTQWLHLFFCFYFYIITNKKLNEETIEAAERLKFKTCRILEDSSLSAFSSFFDIYEEYRDRDSNEKSEKQIGTSTKRREKPCFWLKGTFLNVEISTFLTIFSNLRWCYCCYLKWCLGCWWNPTNFDGFPTSFDGSETHFLWLASTNLNTLAGKRLGLESGRRHHSNCPDLKLNHKFKNYSKLVRAKRAKYNAFFLVRESITEIIWCSCITDQIRSNLDLVL